MAPKGSDENGLWIGPAYERGWQGRKLLIVAEGMPESATGFRIGRGLEAELTQGYVDGTTKNRQFTDVARLVIGEAADRSGCADFFRQVAFINLPRLPLRAHPSKEDWDNARRTLQAVLSDLEPQVVLLLGLRLSEELEQEIASSRPVPLAVTVPHPGTPGFDFRDQTEATSVLRASGPAEE